MTRLREEIAAVMHLEVERGCARPFGKEVCIMAKAGLEAVVARWMSDQQFRSELSKNPTAALEGFVLTPEEIAAIATRDDRTLVQLGLDERIVKATLN